jgi:hypothetical protein
MTWCSTPCRPTYLGHGIAPLLLSLIRFYVLVARRVPPKVRVAFVSDKVFNLPGAQPASIHDLLWQLDLMASTFRFTGAMHSPKAKHDACFPFDGRSFRRKGESFPFALRV